MINTNTLKMNKKSKIHVLSLLATLVTTNAFAVGYPHVVSANDRTDASSITFVEPSKAWRNEGVFPNLESISKMQVGLTKQEVYTAFGKPHFSEGLFAVRQWDYIFKFNVANKVEVCQYQIRYDNNVNVANTYWSRPECVGYATINKVVAVEPQIVDRIVEKIVEKPVDRVVEKLVDRQVTVNRLTLQGDALFGFGKSSLGDMLPGGKSQLALLAKSIKANANSIDSIAIIGHTDRLGSDSFNSQLSLDRANTIRDALLALGVAGTNFRTSGMGANQPVKTCTGAYSASLVACLQDNRRVEIEVVALVVGSINAIPANIAWQSKSWEPVLIKAKP